MDKRDKKIRQLENERNQLMAENQELKYIINDIQSVNDIMREDIEKESSMLHSMVSRYTVQSLHRQFLKVVGDSQVLQPSIIITSV